MNTLLLSLMCFLNSEEPVMKVGAAAIDMTPEKHPVSINGGMTDRQSVGVHDKLHVRALVLDDGETTVAFAICDLCMIPTRIVEAAKSKAESLSGIPATHMLIAATHTHSAPSLAPAFQSEPNEEYIPFLIDRIADAIKLAHERRRSAEVCWSVVEEPSEVFNRRWFMKPGTIAANPFGQPIDKVRMNPPVGSADLVEPAGTTDPDVWILAAKNLDGTPIALLANYSLHYVGDVPSNQLSADYFGAFAEKTASLLSSQASKEPGIVAILSNGTSGNINNIDFRNPRQKTATGERIRIVSGKVADAALRAYRSAEFHKSAKISVAFREIELGVRKPTDDEVAAAKKIVEEAKGELRTLPQIYAGETIDLASYPDKVTVPLQAIKIGNLGIAAIPCEVFVEIGLSLKEKSPVKPMFTISLANGYNGYLPTKEHHELGGYETWRAKSSYLEVNAAERIEKELLEMIGELAGK